MTGRVRIGMLGTRHGHAAGKWQALCTNPLVEPVGIYDPDPAPKDQFPDARWMPSAEALLEDPTVAAVAVEARNHQSLPLARAAIDAGKSRVGELGKLVAAHVIPRPSSAVMSLLPQTPVKA